MPSRRLVQDLNGDPCIVLDCSIGIIGKFSFVVGGLGEILDGAAERGRRAHDTITVLGAARVSTASRISPSPTAKANEPEPTKCIRIAQIRNDPLPMQRPHFPGDRATVILKG